MATKKVNKATFKFGGETINLSKSKTQVAVRYTPGMKRAKKRKNAADQEHIRDFEVVKSTRGIDQKLDALRAKPEVSVGTHIWIVDGEDDSPFIPTGYLYIEFKPGTIQEKQQAVLDELHLNIRQIVSPEAYRVSTTPDSPNPVKCAMLLQKNRIVKIAEPEFMAKPVTGDFSPPTGRFIGSQWHHENSGGQIPIIDIPNAVFGTQHFKKGADAKVRAAWEELQGLGSRNIKIAVIDTGFDTDHPALRGDGTKVRNTFNAPNRSADVSPWFQASDGSWGVFSHGTSCAAVAAGAWDAQGVLGAAPNARIIPIKLDILSDDAIQKAFEHALLNGADIISCSLGFPKPVPLSTFISNYISKVVREGRNGKGLPIFIAAGNANPASNNLPRQVSDFAAHPDVMCITASNSLDESSSYTFFGANAFLCAPTNGNDGVGVTTATVSANGDSLIHAYTSRFGGTSSATPLAAGVCALMLSANPDLTLSQIKDILRRSTDKIGSGYDANGRSPKLGYGRLNALRAVQMAAGNSGTGTGSAGNAGSGNSGTGGSSGTGTGGGQAATQRGKVTSKFLNVRTGPGTSNPKVAELHQGDMVNLFEKVGGFWRIGNGQFVSADFIQVIASNGAPAPVTRKGKVTSTFLNVRTGPATSNAKVGELKKGAAVSIFETSSNGWHRIGDKRWVIGTNIQEV
ncbi:MAG: S8 family serine peptidase [Phycisphaerae bacterium]|nr:S8 family serine peptidase [Saprospiraceae bacterium]